MINIDKICYNIEMNNFETDSNQNHSQFDWTDTDQAEMERLATRAKERRNRQIAEAEAYALAEGEVDEISDESNRDALDIPLTEELELDSEIQSVAENIGKIAAKLGVKNAKAINEETIHALDDEYWHDIPLRDAILEMWDDALGFVEAPRFEDLLEDELQNGDRYRYVNEITKEATDYLNSIGIDRMELLEWGLMGSEQQKHAMRCLMWIMRRDFMQAYALELQARASTLECSISFQAVAKEITDEDCAEIKKQFDNYYFKEEPIAKFDEIEQPRAIKRHHVFSTEKILWSRRTRKAFEIAEKEMAVTIGVCEQVLIPDLQNNVYHSPSQ